VKTEFWFTFRELRCDSTRGQFGPVPHGKIEAENSEKATLAVAIKYGERASNVSVQRIRPSFEVTGKGYAVNA
jgi:hypothetical protein